MSVDVVIDPDYALFVRRVQGLMGVDLNGYKPAQMRRRLTALAARFGVDSLAAFGETMAKDEKAFGAFKNFFTINVSEFFRDASRWEDLAGQILPRLLSESGRQPLKIWSAGCSFGAEPYTLAMMLEELSPGRTHSIVATDIDDGILARAESGFGYLESDLKQVDQARREKFFTRDADGTYAVVPMIKKRVRFLRQDLLAQVLDHGLDLIICRNVVIYFTEDAKRSLYERMYAALRPGGVVFVGGTEIIAGARELGLEPVLTSFYHKGGLRRAGAA